MDYFFGLNELSLSGSFGGLGAADLLFVARRKESLVVAR